MIKKILQLGSLLFLSILLGCEQKFDNVIDNISNEFQTVEVLPVNYINYNSADSLVTLSIKFNSSENIQNVFCEVYAPDNSKSNLTLFDDGKVSNGDFIKGDNIFSNKIALGYFSPSGTYNIKYYVTDLSNNTSLVAVGSFKYNNGQSNVTPVISNLVLADSTERNVPLIFSVDVSDSNGLSDILKVYYELYRPNGSKVINSQGISQFPMFDNGDTSANGDLFANDGTFTVKLTFPNDSGVPSGDWRFEFTAVDRVGMLSNKIIKTVKVL